MEWKVGWVVDQWRGWTTGRGEWTVEKGGGDVHSGEEERGN